MPERLINAYTLKLDVRKNLMPNVDDEGMVSVENAERYFLNLIDKQPTADVVEVVRCKDCKHFTAGYCCRDIKGRSQMHYMGEEAFCSYGERRTDNDL